MNRTRAVSLVLAAMLAVVDPGDEVVVEVQGVGRLVNRIVSEAEFFAHKAHEATA